MREAGVVRAVRRRTPRGLKRVVRKAIGAGRAGLAVVRARVDLVRAKRDLRRRYGPGLVFTVHDQDEMFQFMVEFWYWEHHVVPMRSAADAMRGYLLSGDAMTRDLEGALRDHGRDLAQLGSFLEFASGYGRFTRFLVSRLDPERVTVSDISRPAVDFARSTFGVSGFYSTESADDLDHAGRYEVIFVASLFSHLAIEHWGDWLARLHGLLEPGGLLIVSTHGPYARDVIYGKSWQEKLEEKADGFSFLRTNETDGRLAPEYYGSAFVTQAYVESVVAARGLGTIRHVYPAKLWGSQDLYVIEKADPAG